MAVVIGATAFVGGTAGCLDAFDGNDFTVGSAFATVFDGGKPKTYEYISTTDTENSPYLIRPDTNGTGKAWRQCSIISGDCTLYITSAGNDSTGNGTSNLPWATLGKAVSWLSDKEVATSATITISIGAGTFVEAGLITLVGNIFKNVKIVGAGSSSTTLSWAAAGTGGIVIDHCTALQDIKNIKLLGGSAGNGLRVNANSSCYSTADLLISSFSFGVQVNESSSVNLDGALTASYNSYGLVAYTQSNANVSGCTFDNNTNDGVYANYYSRVYADSSTSTNNTNGYRAYRDSYINALSCTVSGNTTDYSPAKTTANDPTFGNLGSWIYG